MNIRTARGWSFVAGALLVGCSRAHGCGSSPPPTSVGAVSAGDAEAPAKDGAAALGETPDRGGPIVPLYESTPPSHFTRVAYYPGESTRFGRNDNPIDLVASGAGKPTLVSCHSLRHLGSDLLTGDRVPIAMMASSLTCGTVLGVDQDQILAAGEPDQLRAIDIASGALTWRSYVPVSDDASAPSDADAEAHGPHGVYRHPVAVGDVVAYYRFGVAPEPSTLFALDKRTGKTLWQAPHRARQLLASADGTTLLVVEAMTDSWYLTALDPATGAKRWSTPFALPTPGCRILNAAAGANSVAIAFSEFAGQDGATKTRAFVSRFDEKSGALQITKDLADPAQLAGSQVALFGDELYAYGFLELARLDPQTLAVMWKGPGVVGPMARGRDALFVGREYRDEGQNLEADGTVRALDPASGNELWSYGVGLTPRLRVVDTAYGEILMVANGLDVSGEHDEVTLFRRGPDALAPNERTVEIEIDGFKSPNAVFFDIGSRRVKADGKLHWRGTVQGHGRVRIEAASRVEEIKTQPAYAVVDLDAPDPLPPVKFGAFVFEQACIR